MIAQQEIGDRFAVFQGDCIEVIKAIPDDSIHLSLYSPPFCGLYNYSSDPQDMSNCSSYDSFLAHYRFLVKEISRVTMPGRMSCVHCMDVPDGDELADLPGDIIRMHKAEGWKYHARFAIWKEPLRVAIRTRSKGLTHRQLVKDSTFSNNAGADFLLVFKKRGDNPTPVTKLPAGMLKYSGEREIPTQFTGKDGITRPASVYYDWEDQSTNKLAHWIWQQYASSFWDDIRINRVLPYVAARDSEEEKHVHPLQLDVVDRCVQLWSNPNEKCFTPFMGVGSEVCSPLSLGRKGIGVELKASYYRQALRNIRDTLNPKAEDGELPLGADVAEPELEEAMR